MKSKPNRGFTLIEVVLIVAVVGLLALAGWYAYQNHLKTTSTGSTSMNTTTTGQPQIPAKGVYLGGWINPGRVSGAGGGSANEITQLAAFNSSIGKSVAILHVWAGFKAAVPTTTLTAIAKNGSIPIIDWGCTDVASIASGSQDSTINSFAAGLKSYGKPVFLRWYWEFNEMGPTGNTPAGSGCNGYNNGSGYAAAWQHIYHQFKADGVTNVAFVWCPGYSGGNIASYYPGDQYVDWIGIDRYERTKNNASLLSFKDMFGTYYDEWVSHNKPIMIAETAAMGSTYQSQYLSSVGSEISQFPQIKAFVYFDSTGPAGDWQLLGDGVTAFKTLVNSSSFITSVQ